MTLLPCLTSCPRLPRRYTNDKGRDTSAPIVGESGSTALHFAAANGHTSVISTLLAYGARPDLADKHGVTPEMLARENGWLECAELLKEALIRMKEEDKKERERGIAGGWGPDGTANTTVPDGDGSGRRKLHAKRSTDNSFSIFKSSSSCAPLHNRSETHLQKVPSSSSNHPPTPPKVFGEYTFQPPSSSSSSVNNSHTYPSRRPSLPHISNTDPTHTPPRPAFKRAPKRPQSAGTGADRRDDAAGQRKLGTKLSLLGLFKKAGDSSSQSHTPDRSGNSSGRQPTTPSSITSVLPPADSLPRFGGSSSNTNSPRGGVPIPLPSAVELHNAITRHTSRESPSMRSVPLPIPHPRQPYGATEDGVPTARPGTGGSMNSVNRNGGPGILLAHTRSSSSGGGHAHSHSNSFSSANGSASTLPTSPFKSLRFDASSSSNRSSPSSAITTSPKMMKSPRTMRSSSFSSLRKTIVGTRDAPVDDDDEEIHIDVEADDADEEDEEYGVPLERPIMSSPSASLRHHTIPEGPTKFRPNLNAIQTERSRGYSIGSSSSSLSPILSPDAITTDFPYHSPHEGAEDRHLAVPSPSFRSSNKEKRDRGDSISSLSTDGSGSNQAGSLSMSGTTIASTGSGGSTRSGLTPSQTSYSPSQLRSPSSPRSVLKPPPMVYDYPSNDDDGTPAVTPSLKDRRAHTPIDIDIRSISSHAQAEVLVQKAQQSILEGCYDSETGSESGHRKRPEAGLFDSTPLSAKLAAYGETLALERRLREEEEREKMGDIMGKLPGPGQARERRPSHGAVESRGVNGGGLDRQLSLEQKPKARRREPRRPNTSSGTAADPRKNSLFPFSDNNCSEFGQFPPTGLRHHSFQLIDIASSRTNPRLMSRVLIKNPISSGTAHQSSTLTQLHPPSPLSNLPKLPVDSLRRIILIPPSALALPIRRLQLRERHSFLLARATMMTKT